LADHLQKTYPDSTVELAKGSGGVFDVHADDALVYSKYREGRFPSADEIVEKIDSIQKG